MIAVASPNEMRENVYGHAKRLRWIVSHIRREDAVVEVGCGTGYMVALPLARMGYDVTGVDTHRESIAYGQERFREAGLDPERLKVMDFAMLDASPDVVIASEVFEHIPGAELAEMLRIVREKLKPGGRLLVTVPNGYGGFEIEKLVWDKLRMDRVMEFRIVGYLLGRLQAKVLAPLGFFIFSHPATLSGSPHVQRFTFSGVRKTLRKNGFEVIEQTGSVLFCGPFSNTFFSGIGPIMRLNCFLGGLLRRFASGYYIACKKGSERSESVRK